MSGPYEMVAGSLSDSIVYDCENKKAWYQEDLPEDNVNSNPNPDSNPDSKPNPNSDP